jgi:colicin import membrane protein
LIPAPVPAPAAAASSSSASSLPDMAEMHYAHLRRSEQARGVGLELTIQAAALGTTTIQGHSLASSAVSHAEPKWMPLPRSSGLVASHKAATTTSLLSLAVPGTSAPKQPVTSTAPGAISSSTRFALQAAAESAITAGRKAVEAREAEAKAKKAAQEAEREAALQRQRRAAEAEARERERQKAAQEKAAAEAAAAELQRLQRAADAEAEAKAKAKAEAKHVADGPLEPITMDDVWRWARPLTPDEAAQVAAVRVLPC